MRLLIISIFICLSGGTLNPAQYFGDSFSESVNFYRKNRTYYSQFFHSFGVDPNMAAAVVFPETIRYNRFRDFLETSALEIAYVKGGKSVSDFSIGRFQMKPSFVEELEEVVAADITRHAKYAEIIAYEGCSTLADIRKARVMRLKQFRWQVLYLACFVTIATTRYANEIQAKPEETLLILSSAYNLGLSSDYGALVSVSRRKSFPYGNQYDGRFSYYDVANFFYHNYTF